MTRMIIPRNFFITALWRSRRYLIKSAVFSFRRVSSRGGRKDSKKRIYSFRLLYVYIILCTHWDIVHKGRRVLLEFRLYKKGHLEPEDPGLGAFYKSYREEPASGLAETRLATMAERCRPRAFPRSLGHRGIIGFDDSIGVSVIIPRFSHRQRQRRRREFPRHNETASVNNVPRWISEIF